MKDLLCFAFLGAFATVLSGCSDSKQDDVAQEDANAHVDGSLPDDVDGGACVLLSQDKVLRLPAIVDTSEGDMAAVVAFSVLGGTCADSFDELQCDPLFGGGTLVSGCGIVTAHRGYYECHYSQSTGDLMAVTVAYDAFNERGGCEGVIFFAGDPLPSCDDLEQEPMRCGDAVVDAGTSHDAGDAG